MPFNFERSIKFVIPGHAGSPSVEIFAVERDGGLVFEVQLLNVKSKSAQLSGLFMDFNEDSKLADLTYTGSSVSKFKTGNVLDLDQGTNIQGQASPFDIGLKFGSSGMGKDSIQSASFFLFNATQPLTLDDIANVDFGVRLAGLGNLGGSGDSAKLTVVAPAAPDARDDAYQIFEDGQTGLAAPSHTPEGIIFQVLDNDTDADGEVLKITDVQGFSHGEVSIIDGDDDGTEIGDALLYTPFEDYSGDDLFYYAISDGHGGTDFSRVDVQIDAVADVPEFDFEILEGRSVNELVVRVTASQTDADISEFIDRIEITGLPHSVSIDGALFDPTSESATLSHDFVISVPTYDDSNFDLTITAFSKEKSNGDEESDSQTFNVNYEYTQNDFDHTFAIESQSMWSSNQAWSFTDNRFLGVDSGANGRLDASVGVGSAYAIYDIDYKFGLQSTLNITSGEVDASVPYSVQIESLYNETTDWLRFETDQWLDLNNASFETRSPLLTYALKLIANVQTALTLGASIDIPGTPALEIAGETIIPAIPGWSWGSSTTASPGFSASPTLFEFDGDSLNLLGQEGDSALNIDLGYGLSIDAAIPHYDTESSVVGNHLESSGSANFLTLNADMDEILTMLMGIPNPFGVSIGFGPASVNLNLLNYVLSGSMGVGQDFVMNFGNVNGTMVFEDGHEYDFVFGSDFDIHGASEHDANNDGILEFEVEIDPQATFASDFLLTLELAHELQILAASMSISVPVFDDPEFDLGSVYEYEGVLANTDIKLVAMPSFSFNLGETNELFTV